MLRAFRRGRRAELPEPTVPVRSVLGPALRSALVFAGDNVRCAGALGAAISTRMGLVCLLGFAFIALAPGAEAGEKLVYSIVHKGSDYTAAKTEIFAVDPETREERLVFSDEATSIVLTQSLYVFHFPVAAGGKLFARAAGRRGALPAPAESGLYELAADGSDAVRRIGPLMGDGSAGDLFLNASGTRIGYVSGMDRRQFIFLHDVATGALLHKIDVTETFLDCYATSIGWVPGRERLYFSLDTGDADLTSEESYGRVGTYLMDEDGRHLEKLAALPLAGGSPPLLAARAIGALPSGEYLFETMQPASGEESERHPFRFSLRRVRADLGEGTDMSFSPAATLYTGIQVAYSLSPSGRYVAAASLPVSDRADSCAVWLKDLDRGEERIVVAIPTTGLEGPFLGLAGWFE